MKRLWLQVSTPVTGASCAHPPESGTALLGEGHREGARQTRVGWWLLSQCLSLLNPRVQGDGVQALSWALVAPGWTWQLPQSGSLGSSLLWALGVQVTTNQLPKPLCPGKALT